MRLTRLAIEHRLDLEGHLVGQGAIYGMEDLPINRFLGYVWWYFTKDADERQRDKFKAALWRPPTIDTPIPKESPWSAENEMKAFSALKAETGS
jgi:hypothetical protein